MQTVCETTDATKLVDAEKLVAAVAEFRTLVHRFHAEGLDEMFLHALDDELMQWEPNAQREWREAAIAAAQS